MSNDNSNHPEPNRRYKPIELSNLMIRTFQSVHTALQAMSEYARFCSNPDCGSLITFHANEVRPVVCAECGRDIDWGERSMTVGTCPKCNEEFNINSVYCPFHSPPVLLEEKRIRLYPSSSGGDDPPVGF